jgi:hypothetical protein
MEEKPRAEPKADLRGVHLGLDVRIKFRKMPARSEWSVPALLYTD